MMSDKNQQTYTALDVVDYYSQLAAIQPGEATIRDLLQPQLSKMKMLDIGVGAGRTTQHFASIVGEYLGIDYSQTMIAACQRRFPQSAFAVCDARDLSQFADDSFDFMLFSFNGIDFMSHSSRLELFAEVRRIGKPGSYFYFSSHNLVGMEREFDFKRQFSFNPVKTYVGLMMSAFLHGFNFPTTIRQLQSLDYAILKDESHNFRLDTYYIRPRSQITQLTPYFDRVQVYSWKSGLELLDDELDSCSDMWLYYLVKNDETDAQI